MLGPVEAASRRTQPKFSLLPSVLKNPIMSQAMSDVQVVMPARPVMLLFNLKHLPALQHRMFSVRYVGPGSLKVARFSLRMPLLPKRGAAPASDPSP